MKPARIARPHGRRSGAPQGRASLWALPAFLLLYLLGAVFWHVPNLVAVGYATLSVLCFIAYALDKAAAQAGRWRTKESTLLLLGLLGGWPGAILAQQLLRHKSSKASFRTAFWGTVALNVCAFVLLSAQW